MQSDSQEFLHALGRLPLETMNKTEAAYAMHLEFQKREGKVLWYGFECIKINIAQGKKCWYTPDFLVLTGDYNLEIHEVKGARVSAVYKDDAKVKVKVTSATMPFRVKVAFPRRGGGWDVEEV